MLPNNWDLMAPFSSVFISFFLLLLVGLAKPEIHDLSIFISSGLDLIL